MNINPALHPRIKRNNVLKFRTSQTDIFLQRRDHILCFSRGAQDENLVWCNCMHPGRINLPTWLLAWLAWTNLHLCKKQWVLVLKTGQLHGNHLWGMVSGVPCNPTAARSGLTRALIPLNTKSVSHSASSSQ